MPEISSAKDGRYVGYDRKLSELQDELKNEAARARDRESERASVATETLEREIRRNQKEAEAAAEIQRTASAEATEKTKRNARAEVEDMKRQLYDKQGRSMQADGEREKQYALRAISETEKRHAEELKRLNKAQETRFAELSETQKERVEKQIGAERASRKTEVSDLNEKYRQLEQASSKQKAVEDVGQKADFYRDLENQWRAENRNMRKGYESQVAGLKDQLDRTDENYSGKVKEIVQEKDEKLAQTISNGRKENDLDRSTLTKQFDSARGQLEKRNKQTVEASERMLVARNELNERQKDETLGAMQRAAREDLAQQGKRMSTENQRLENEVRYMKNTPNPTAFSDEARRNVEKNWVDNYNKLFTEEQGRNLRSQEQMQQRYNERFAENKLVADRKQSEAIRKFETDKTIDQKHYHEGMLESEDIKIKALRMQEGMHGRELETRDRRNVDSVEKLRRQYEEQIETMRNDHMSRVNAERLDGEFALRMQHRAHTFRQNELIREYEKKLAEQKDELIGLVDHTRATADKAVRDAERDRNRAIEEQKKMYEQKLAMIDAQHKERDRVATQNFQDEIEKVRRSNAVLAQKKS